MVKNIETFTKKRFFLLDWYLILNMKVFKFSHKYLRPILRPLFLEIKNIIEKFKIGIEEIRQNDLYKKLKEKKKRN